MRCVVIFTALALTASPASADLRDVVLSREGDVAWVQIVFDTAPSEAELVSDSGVLSAWFDVDGAVPAAVETADPATLRGIRFTRTGDGIHAELDLAVTWDDARVSAGPDRIVIRLSGLAASGGDVPASHLITAENSPSPDTAMHAVAGTGGADHTDHAGVASPDEAPATGPAALVPGEPEHAEPDHTPEPDGDHANIRATEHADCAAADARITDDPWDLDAMIVQAECARSDGDGAAATELLERVTAMDPQRFSALLMLAELEAETGNRADARALYEMAAQVARTDGQAAAAMARLRALED